MTDQIVACKTRSRWFESSRPDINKNLSPRRGVRRCEDVSIAFDREGLRTQNANDGSGPRPCLPTRPVWRSDVSVGDVCRRRDGITCPADGLLQERPSSVSDEGQRLELLQTVGASVRRARNAHKSGALHCACTGSSRVGDRSCPPVYCRRASARLDRILSAESSLRPTAVHRFLISPDLTAI